MTAPMAKVWIDVGKYCIQREVAVCAKAPEPVVGHWVPRLSS